MKIPNEGTDGLTRDGFDWIALYVIIKVQRVRETLKKNLKNGLKTCLYVLCTQFLVDDIDNMSRDGFDWISQKVIFKVGKVRFDPFSHIHIIQ